MSYVRLDFTLSRHAGGRMDQPTWAPYVQNRDLWDSTLPQRVADRATEVTPPLGGDWPSGTFMLYVFSDEGGDIYVANDVPRAGRRFVPVRVLRRTAEGQASHAATPASAAVSDKDVGSLDVVDKSGGVAGSLASDTRVLVGAGVALGAVALAGLLGGRR